jgi:hypothetical protein
MREKAWSTPRVTIHQRPEICHLGMHFVHKWVRKRSYALCKSCRGIRSTTFLFTSWRTSVQLFGVTLGQTGLLENFRGHWALRNAPTLRAARAAVPLGPDAEAGLPRREPGAEFHTTSGPLSSPHRLPDPFPSLHAPSAHGPCRADPRRQPMASPPYTLHSATALPCPYRGRS